MAMTNAERQWLKRERMKDAGIKDTRKRDRIRTGYMSKRNAAKMTARTFIALDGEGINITPEDQRYAVLAASDGSMIENMEGLTTKQCIDYLMRLKEDNPNSYFVGYSFDYDVNMILRDLTEEQFRQIWRRNYTFMGRFRIEYVKSKYFTVSERERGEDGKWFTPKGQSITIYDTLGFFQTSFIKAMQNVRILDESNPDYAMFTEMKGIRGTFTPELWPDVLAYNEKELEYLVKAMDVLRSGLENIGINLTRWHGAGAIATALYKMNSVKEHFIEAPEWVPVLDGMYGGRIQSFWLGEMGTVHTYDLRSAYPASIEQLPSLQNGTWQTKETNRLIKGNPIALYRVTWDMGFGMNRDFGPFPMRNEKGHISYPIVGHGIYWECEVRAAKETMKHAKIKIHEVWYCDGIDTDSRPFAWMREWYDRRADYKERDMFAEQMSIKLGLNSIFGKTAQGVQARGVKPAYQSYIYAGLITAGTRAAMLYAANNHWQKIVAIATDGIHSAEPLEVNIGKGLGEWESEVVEDYFIIKPGFYQYKSPDGTVTKARGIRGRAVPWEYIRSEWNRVGMGLSYTVEVNTFVTYRTALVRNDMSSHCRWIIEQKRGTLNSAKYDVEDTFNPDLWYRYWTLHKQVAPVNRFSMFPDIFQLSTTYEPKRMVSEDELEEMRGDDDKLIHMADAGVIVE